jgi:hypothetical protein
MTDETDELEQIVDPPTPDPADAPPDDKVEITKEELARLLKSADTSEQLASQVASLSEQLTQRQTQAPPAQTTDDDGITNESFFMDAKGAVNKLIEKQLARQIQPLAETTLGNVAGISISTFKSIKRSDPLFAGVSPLFDKEMDGLSKPWLGRLTSSQLEATLNKAWDASVGRYVQEERDKKRADKARNLSSSRSDSGSGGPTKSLEEIDPGAYRMAVQGGWTEDEMKDFAKTYQDEE